MLCLKEKLGLALLWLLSVASVSFYLSTIAYSGDKNIVIEKKLKVFNDASVCNNSNKERVGFLLASHFSDVHRGSAVNLASLQCWASSIPGKIKVVEPFLRWDSVLGVSLNGGAVSSEEQNSNVVKLSQVYDWNGSGYDQVLQQRKYPPLVSWDNFIKNAPRKIILVDRTCDNSSHICMQCRNGFYKSDVFHFSASEFTRQHGFRVVRRVCHSLAAYSPAKLQALIYGLHRPEDVVVLFNHFGGFIASQNKFRIHLYGYIGWKCKRSTSFFPLFSKYIRQDSARYVNTYYTEARSYHYVSVMIYMKHFLVSKSLKNLPANQQMLKMLSCITEFSEAIKRLKRRKQISSVFISVDTGKYGTVKVKHFRNFHMDEDVYRASLYRLHSCIKENYDEDSAKLESVASVKLSPAYISSLERNILTSGECLVVVGSDSSQNEVIKLFLRHQENSGIVPLCGVHRVCVNL